MTGALRPHRSYGVGTTFTLFLPRCDDGAVEGLAPAAGMETVPRGTETVLIVEGNEMVLEVVREIIAELGYRVLHAADAGEALAIIESGASVDILFSDVAMPNGISGIELAREALRRKPGLGVLITSGYAAVGGIDDATAGNSSRSPSHIAAGISPYLRRVLARLERGA